MLPYIAIYQAITHTADFGNNIYYIYYIGIALFWHTEFG